MTQKKSFIPKESDRDKFQFVRKRNRTKIGICGGEQNGHKVQKSQISYYNRRLYACVSFLKVKKKAELPEDYFVLTPGLSAPLESDRVAAKTEPYPGRWTTHFVISSPSDLDGELFDWIEQAYQFAQAK